MRWQLAGTLIALSCLVGACDDKTKPDTSAATSLAATPANKGLPDKLSPPSPPGGPIPIPYPNVAAESAPTKNSAKVSGKEVVLKDKSQIQKSTGD